MPATRFGAAAPGPQVPPLAVVDIGSNSVRLVVYEGGRRSPATLYNEKEICGLGRFLALDGRLDDASMASALAALARFRILAGNMGVGSVDAVATAAVREAANGAAFLAEAQAALGAPIKVLSGAQEADMAARGVLFGMPRADGVVGDLGGGSLELVDVVGGKVGRGETTPLGALRLSVMADDRCVLTRHIDDTLAGVGILPRLAGRALYAVGGTWRALARLHMEKAGYPLRLIEGYTLEAGQVQTLAREVSRAAPETLNAFDTISPSRLKTLPFGALLFDRLITIAKPAHIVFSAHGLRDGVVLSHLSRDIAARDPLLSAALELGGLRSRSLAHVMELSAWMDPVFSSSPAAEPPAERRLREAACLLSDVAWRVSPDTRAERALELITIGSFSGVDHPGRAFIALAVFHRHEHRLVFPPAVAIAGLVGEAAGRRARAIGTAIRLAGTISAETPGILPRTRLAYDGNLVELTLPGDLAPLAGRRLDRHLGHLASTLGCRGRVTIET